MNNLQTVDRVRELLPDINFINIKKEDGGFTVITFAKKDRKEVYSSIHKCEDIYICVGEYFCSSENISQRIKIY